MNANDVLKHVVCPMCNKTPEHAVEAPCCGDIFCRNCVKQKKTITCRVCRKKLSASEFIENYAVQNIIDRAKKNTLIPCPQGCGQSIATTNLNGHLTECLNGNVQCFTCGVMIKRHKMAKHQTEECPKGERMCEYAEHGCNMKISIPAYADHMRQYAPQHLSMVMSSVKQLHQRLSSQDNNNTHNNELRQRHPNIQDNNTNNNIVYPIPTAPPIQHMVRDSNNSNSNSNRSHPVQNNVGVMIENMETIVSSFFTMISAMVMQYANAIQPADMDRILKKIQDFYQSIIGNSGLPTPAKFAVVILIIWILKGPAFFLIRASICWFVCFAVYRYLATSPFMTTSHSSRVTTLICYVVLVIYLISCLL